MKDHSKNGPDSIMTTRYFIVPFVLTLLFVSGCSSWGGKINNTEGVNYYSKGQYDQALSAFQTAARLNPEDSEVYYNIASTYQQQAARYQDPTLLTLAENHYRRCLEKNPTPETTVCCYRGLATVLNQKKEDVQALKVLKEWEDKEPTSVEPKLEIAYLLEAQGKNAEASEALTKIRDWAPNDYRAFYKLGLVMEKMGKNAEALEQVKAASRLNPTDEEIARKATSLEAKINAEKSAAATPSDGTAVEPAAPSTPPSAAPSASLSSESAVTRKTGGVGNGPIGSIAPSIAEIPKRTESSASPYHSTSGTFHSPEEAAPPLDDEFGPLESVEEMSSPETESAPKEPIFTPPSEAGLPDPTDSAKSTLSEIGSPSYDTPLDETLPVTPPTTSPSDAATDPFGADPPFGSTEAVSSGTLSSVSRPAALPTADPLPTADSGPSAAPSKGPLNDGLTIPDGTGSNRFKLAYRGSPVMTKSPTVPAAAASSSRRSKVGEHNPGPPRTTVGAPF